jgi:hypothetical protein
MVHSAKDLGARSRHEIADRAARVAAMLDRWEAEDVSEEPAWRVEDLEPATFRRNPANPESLLA